MRKWPFLLLVFLSIFACKTPEARRLVSQSSGSFIEESVERNKKLVAQEEELIRQIIEEDSSNTYISSPNGFWYYYNTRDTTATTRTPQFGDVVEFEYTMKTLDGRTIYSEEELPRRTYAMDQEELFSGLREGLKLMHEGETVTFLFPSHKAYGYYGDKNRIGTNLPILSTVTLYSITSNNNNQNQD